MSNKQKCIYHCVITFICSSRAGKIVQCRSKNGNYFLWGNTDLKRTKRSPLGTGSFLYLGLGKGAHFCIHL